MSKKSSVTLISQAILHPRSIGAVFPSSRYLSQAMFSALPENLDFVVEIGAGTGALTSRLISKVKPGRLFVIEKNSQMKNHLTNLFNEKDVLVVHGDAADIGLLLYQHDWPNQIQAVVSGLPLKSIPSQTAARILRNINFSLEKGGVFVQFTYLPFPPIPKDLLEELCWSCELVDVVWANVPPAHVYRYVKN